MKRGFRMGAQVAIELRGAPTHMKRTRQFSIGIGGRYWSAWTTSGSDCREPPNGFCPVPLQNVQYKTERYGMTFQTSYKFGP